MLAASLLTAFAVAGVLAGLWLGHPRALSAYLAAAGGGLLFGIGLFWLVPEIARSSGWPIGLTLPLLACVLFFALDIIFERSVHQVGRYAIPLVLLAAAVHSFLDGWSVRALAGHGLANLAVPAGLALHKIPEGLALGWIARRSGASSRRAAAAGISVELMTLLGAWVEPRAADRGFSAFGVWWTSSVIAIVAGSFLFLGLHAVLPSRTRAGVVAVFLLTAGLLALAGLFSEG